MSILNLIEELQWKQLEHDVRYHKDIWVLNTQDRARHMTLHICKYSGQLLEAVRRHEDELILKYLVDTIIIAFSYANIFQCSISKILAKHTNDRTTHLTEIIRNIAKEYKAENLYSAHSPLDLAMDFCILSARIAKAAESLDHLEIYPYRESFNSFTKQILYIVLTLCDVYGIYNFDDLISERLVKVESKNMFFSKYGNHKTGYL